MDTYHELLFRVQLEQLVTEREAMIAANQAREQRDLTQAYPETAFFALQERFISLENLIRLNG